MISEGNIEVIISRSKLLGWIMKMCGFHWSVMSILIVYLNVHMSLNGKSIMVCTLPVYINHN